MCFRQNYNLNFSYTILKPIAPLLPYTIAPIFQTLFLPPKCPFPSTSILQSFHIFSFDLIYSRLSSLCLGYVTILLSHIFSITEAPFLFIIFLLNFFLLPQFFFLLNSFSLNSGFKVDLKIPFSRSYLILSLNKAYKLSNNLK